LKADGLKRIFDHNYVISNSSSLFENLNALRAMDENDDIFYVKQGGEEPTERKAERKAEKGAMEIFTYRNITKFFNILTCFI